MTAAVRIRAGAITRAIAIALLLAVCAGGAFLAGRALSSGGGSATVAVRPFTPSTMQIHDARALGLDPGLPALARR